jgi:hypothetical protein
MVSQGVPWPEMAGDELRDVMAFLQGGKERPGFSPYEECLSLP